MKTGIIWKAGGVGMIRTEDMNKLFQTEVNTIAEGYDRELLVELMEHMATRVKYYGYSDKLRYDFACLIARVMGVHNINRPLPPLPLQVVYPQTLLGKFLKFFPAEHRVWQYARINGN